MKKFVRFVAVLMVAATLSGCSDWISNFKKDPIAQTQTMLSQVETIISIATMIFGQAKAALPADKAAEVQKSFDAIVLSIENSKTLVLDGLAAAKAAGTDPNLGAIVDILTKSVVDLQKLVDSIKAVGSKLGAGPDDDLAKAVHTYQKFAVEIK